MLMDKILIVSKTQKSIDILTLLLKSSGYINVQSVQSTAEARRIMSQTDFSLVIVNTPLSDEFGTDLSIDVTQISLSSVILIAKSEMVNDLSEKVENYGVIVMGNPINKTVFYQTLKLALASRRRIMSLQNKTTSFKEKIEEIRYIDKAKCILIKNKSLTEEQAHKFIEKTAMNNRLTRKEVAQNIINEFCI